MADLKGQVALVTGASRGIGSVIARYLGEAGVNVGVNYVAREDAASQVVDSVTKAGAEAVLESVNTPPTTVPGASTASIRSLRP